MLTSQGRQRLSDLAESFWLLPGMMVAAGILLALMLVQVDRSGIVPQALIDSPWLYNGGGTGARTLLGAVASSTIGVAGTVFSITIASLSLAAGQMGPRLLRNFVRDRGNQFTLGAFLGTFSYALMVLRSVRTRAEGEFIPHVSMSAGIVLAFVCVGTLVFFVGHMVARINVDTVIELVSQDVCRAIRRLTLAQAPAPGTAGAIDPSFVAIRDGRRGYLQQLDADRLADWAAHRGVTIHLLVRPGDLVFPGAVIALASPQGSGVAEAIRRTTALGPQRVSTDDLEFSIRQLVEVAVRALSPGINDPHTAMAVIDRLGVALCDLAPRYLPDGRVMRGDRPVLVMPVVHYDGLVDAMLHMIRQNATGNTAVLIRILDVLNAVIGCERAPARMAVLQRHADLVLGDGERDIATPADLADLRSRHARFAELRHCDPHAVPALATC
ncbi:DUF2254 domain-containing protein [Novosphingobium sp.]|uniref:DUF2254 domain-containing protein n=1 Tax=Novosphingobium sp. TaxID=1874826 RepID=UPI003B52986C